MMRRIGFLAGILVLALVLAVPQASAQRLFGTVSTGTDDDPATSTLVEIDPDDGSLIATIGDVGYAVNGMTWDETTGTLYATTSGWDETFPNGLITINPSTAAATTIGTGAGQYVNVPASNSAGQLYGWTEETDDPVIWNKAAGTITVLDSGMANTRKTGLAFDASDTLYLINDYNWNQDGQSVYTINTTTGAATAVGALPGLPYNCAHHGDFHPTTNLYYGIDAAGGRDGVTARNLLVINIGTLTVVDTIPTVDNLQTLTFLPDDDTAPQSIPTLSEWGMILMALMLAGSALWLIRRRIS